MWNLGPVNSVQTLKLTKRAATTDPFVLRSIDEADGIFIAGGDQSDYVRIWKDSPVQDAINAAVSRGVPIGGISAGLAVQGEFSFSAEKGTAVSDHVLRNPFSNKVRLQRDFLQVPHLADTITDSHSWRAIGWVAWSHSWHGPCPTAGPRRSEASAWTSTPPS